MNNRFKKERLYARLASALSHTPVKRLRGILRKRRAPVFIESMWIETMNDLLARFDPKRHCGELASKAAPRGQEFGARTGAADRDK